MMMMMMMMMITSQSRNLQGLLSSTRTDTHKPQINLNMKLLSKLFSSELQLELRYSSSGVEAFRTGF